MTIEKVKFMSEGLSSLINMLNKKVCKCNLLKKKQRYICIYIKMNNQFTHTRFVTTV